MTRKQIDDGARNRSDPIPDKAEVFDHVCQVLAAFTRTPVAQIQAGDFLQADLHFSSESLPYLAMAFRAYVQHFSDNTLLVSEISDSTMTVQQSADLISKKL